MVKPLSRAMQSLIARGAMGGSGRGLSAPVPSVMAPVGAAQLVANVRSESGGKVVNSNVRPDSWGNAETFTPPWSDGESRVVLDVGDIKAPTQADWRIPYTQALILASKSEPFNIGNFFTRWLIEVGIGDGRTTFTIDAGGVQQITLPAASIRVLFQVVRGLPTLVYSSPSDNINVSAFMSDGTTATTPPTFTQAFSIGANAAGLFVAPVGATGFRIASSQLPGPYTANTVFNVQNNTFGIDTFNGAYLLNIRQDFIPFSGQAISLEINNVANPAGIQGFVVWSIDL